MATPEGRADLYLADNINRTLATGNLMQGKRRYGLHRRIACLWMLIYGRKLKELMILELIFKNYYNRAGDSSTPENNQYRKRLNLMNPLSLYNNTPDINLQTMNGVTPPTAKMKNGGYMKAEDGLQVEDNQYTPISHNMIMLNGDSHAKGGTDVAYNGTQVEAEAGEPVSIGMNNEAVIWGNMRVPGTKQKFKSVAKSLGEAENKIAGHDAKAQELLQNNDQTNPYEKFGFNSGRIMQIGAAMGQGEINNKKEQLASLQKALLQVADQHGVDPQALSMGKVKKAKYGLHMAKYGEDIDGPGKPTRSDRHNNPGNLKFVPNSYQTKLGAVQGEKAPDGGYYAKFPTRESW